MQAVLLLAGQAAALRTGWLETRAVYAGPHRAWAGFAPTAVLVTLFTLLLLRLFAG